MVGHAVRVLVTHSAMRIIVALSPARAVSLNVQVSNVELMAVVASVAYAPVEWGVSQTLDVHPRRRLMIALSIVRVESVVRMAAPLNAVCVQGAPPVGRLVSARGASRSA